MSGASSLLNLVHLVPPVFCLISQWESRHIVFSGLGYWETFECQLGTYSLHVVIIADNYLAFILMPDACG
jgi:hypothetical protein